MYARCNQKSLIAKQAFFLKTKSAGRKRLQASVYKIKVQAAKRASGMHKKCQRK